MPDPSRIIAPFARVDLAALAANYKTLKLEAARAETAPAVKADAYGLGAEAVVQKLSEQGCKTFFTAYASEAIGLRAIAPYAVFFALHGVSDAAPEDLLAHNIVPVLNDPGAIAQWKAFAAARGKKLPACIHIDTGINRLGLTPGEMDALCTDPHALDGINAVMWASHFACADEAGHPMNRRQIESFRAALARLPAAPASMSNSCGIYLGQDAHFNMTRPGIALYGGNPLPGKPNPMQTVVTLYSPVIQVRDVAEGMTIGYGATHKFARPARTATLALGYADGYHRTLGNTGTVWINGVAAPVIGRVSMDLITVDITGLPENSVKPGTLAEIFGPSRPVDKIAAEAKTISYEILTSLGSRIRRIYS
ncbi:MAG: alanine racemase [Alphaproteobacteria bacterium]|nr:alanine racemase [Alphaproteobacteria bacterium]